MKHLVASEWPVWPQYDDATMKGQYHWYVPNQQPPLSDNRCDMTIIRKYSALRGLFLGIGIRGLGEDNSTVS